MKSECPHIKQFLSEYIDGVLDAAKMTLVEEHIRACNDCRMEYELLRSIIGKLNAIGEVKAPDNILEKIHDRIKDDSILNRIREIVSFKRIGIPPLEWAAIATTAVLILLLFNFFHAENNNIIKHPFNNNEQLSQDHTNLSAQIDVKQDQSGQTVDYPTSTPQIKAKRIPIKLALALTIQEERNPIPSRSVSFGDNETMNNDVYVNQTETKDEVSKRFIHPDEINKKIDEIIKSVKGKLISLENSPETGYPIDLKIEIPAVNYRRFISNIEMLGALRSAVPDLPEGSEYAGVFIQIELTSQE